MRTILSIIMILASVGGLIGFIFPTYQDVQAIGNEKAEYSQLLDSANELADRRDELIGIYNTIDKTDIERLEKMLPANPDNVKLILEIDALAKANGLILQNVSIQESEQSDARQGRSATTSNPDIGTLGLQFTTVGSYPGYVQFIQTLEKNLRIMNVQKISFVAPEEKSSYQYQTTVETYWVK